MKSDKSYKVFFINYAILTAILVVIIGLLFFPIKAAQKSWQNKLKTQVEFVLDESEPNGWTVGNTVKISNSFALSSACYEALNRKSGQTYKVIIIRVLTFYGPLPAVFTIDAENNIDFIGYSSLHGRIAKQAVSNKSNKRINFWKKKIPYIIQ